MAEPQNSDQRSRNERMTDLEIFWMSKLFNPLVPAPVLLQRLLPTEES